MFSMLRDLHTRCFRKHRGTPDSQYEYLKMPFVLKNGPSEFQRFMNAILREFIEAEKLVVYLDDIIIATADFH